MTTANGHSSSAIADSYGVALAWPSRCRGVSRSAIGAHAFRRVCFQFVLLALVACGGATSESPLLPPAVPVPPSAPAAAVSVSAVEIPQGVTVGSPFRYDVTQGRLRFADPHNGGLTYAISLSPSNAGLTAVGTVITGIPGSAGIITATIRATDVSGASAESHFAIIALSADLTAPVLPAVPFAYSDITAPMPLAVATSPQVVKTDNTPATNRVTDAGAALGRVLFYDRRLSANDRIACASCHQQQFSFGDSARLSRGVQGEFTARHSMPLINTRFYRQGRFFRDERAASLEALILQPIMDRTEMGLPLDLLVPKLQMAGYYGPLFTAAFGDSTITTERVALSVSQFVRALLSTRSRLDSSLSGTAEFTKQEAQGLILFEGFGCRGCHESYVLVSDSARNTGLDASNTDPGAGGGRFKAPSLRNIAVRAPYMHDGRFSTLEEVIDFYDKGVNENASLDPLLREHDGRPRRLHLSASDKAALTAFLHTLTDRAFLTDPRYANPFKH